MSRVRASKIASLLIVLGLVGGLGYYLGTSGGSESSDALEAVKSSSSFEKISEEGEVDIRSYNISGETVSKSEESDYPYNWTAEGLGGKKSTFILAVDFAGFAEEESRLVIAKSSSSAHIYQLQDGEVINDISALGLLGQVRQAENERERKQACRNSNVSVTEASINEGGFSVQLSASGDLARWIQVKVNTEGENFEKDELIGAGGNETFEFEEVQGLENVESIELSSFESDPCETERTISELPQE